MKISRLFILYIDRVIEKIYAGTRKKRIKTSDGDNRWWLLSETLFAGHTALASDSTEYMQEFRQACKWKKLRVNMI